MTTTQKGAAHKSLNSPDETRKFDKGKADTTSLGDVVVTRLELQPGWRWSQSLKPVVQTEWCEHTHIGYMVSGRLKTKLRDGTEDEAGPGDVVYIPAGHDGWVVGNETVVLLDFNAGSARAK